MPLVYVTDLYEAAYLLMNGCTIESISCIELSKTVSCRICISGKDVQDLSENMRNRTASGNLYQFRNAYSTVNSFVHEAKKNFSREKKGGESL
ncbi:MAG: hypothetical protein HUK25_00790 [Treponema sp.]|nr:hypothetical protein [Treponema sp.]